MQGEGSVQRKRKLIFLICFLAVVGCGYLIIHFINERERAAMLRSGAYSVGKMFRVFTMKSRGTVGYYTFNIGEEEWAGEITSARLLDLGSAVFKRSFPVIYDSLDPKQSQILIFPDQFEYYHLPFPDSLQWIQDIEK
jgi:hypothetical protein